MQEISPKVFIETSYPGVTLGAIDWTHGLILVDAPFRPEDIRAGGQPARAGRPGCSDGSQPGSPCHGLHGGWE